MNLFDYQRHILALLKKDPTAGMLPVAFSSDNEGNNFSLVHYSPGVQNIDLDCSGETTKVVVIN